MQQNDRWFTYWIFEAFGPWCSPSTADSRNAARSSDCSERSLSWTVRRFWYFSGLAWEPGRATLLPTCRDAFPPRIHPSTRCICSKMNKNPSEALGDKVKRNQTQKSFSSPSKSGMLYMNHLLGFIKDIAERCNSSFLIHFTSQAAWKDVSIQKLFIRNKVKDEESSNKPKAKLPSLAHYGHCLTALWESMQPLGKFLIYFPFLLFASSFEELAHWSAPTAIWSYARELLKLQPSNRSRRIDAGLFVYLEGMCKFELVHLPPLAAKCHAPAFVIHSSSSITVSSGDNVSEKWPINMTVLGKEMMNKQLLRRRN